MQNRTQQEENIKKLAELIKDVKVAMLTTIEQDGSLRSRPMMTQQQEFNGELWFLTQASAPKVTEFRQNQQVNLAYAQPDSQTYVSVSGVAQLVRDPQKIKELWNPIYKAWFPDGLDDPDLALIKVQADKAEYWESPSGKVVQLVGFVKALATGERADLGENRKVDL